jgi:hypothetical protein
MITIFCDFCQFLAKKLVFFLKTKDMMKILHNLALLWVKNVFLQFLFGENILKIITSVPGHPARDANTRNENESRRTEKDSPAKIKPAPPPFPSKVNVNKG